MKIRMIGLTAAALAATLAAGATEDRKPNVLVFLIDDTGWGECGFQGATDIPTPNMDSIAKGGVRFTSGYVSGPYCSPTRAGLMTGRYQTRFGHEFNGASKPGLVKTETTMADRLRAAGYSTCAIGKWHLGSTKGYYPMDRGFDEFYGTLANTPFLHPTQFVDSRVSPDVQSVEADDFYTTDAYAERAVDWLEKQKGKPWFLYVPFNAQHAPLEALPKYLDRFPNVSDQKRRTFSAMMSAMDDAVGRVLAKVKELKQEEHTIIFFLSDNGGPTAGTTSRNGPLHGFKATTWEGGVRVPFCMQWKGVVPAGRTYDHPVIQLDILPTCLSAAGVKIDPAWRLDGVDLIPFLTGKNDGKPHETFYWRFGKQMAIRHGDHKLVIGNGGTGKPELYNLAEDIGETKDLAAAKPDKAAELQKLWDAWHAEQAPASTEGEKPAAARKKKARTGKKAP